MDKFVRNPHTFDDSWWDGPQRFQWVNRNVISQTQHEDMFKFIKAFAHNKIGLDIGGLCGAKRSTWSIEEKPFALKLNLSSHSEICARAEKLPFQNEVIGYIVSFHTFEHIRGNPKETAKEWLRVLVPGGLLGISMPDKRFFLHNPEVVEDGDVAYHEMDPKELLDLFSNFNVEIMIFDSRKNNFDFDIIVRKKDGTNKLQASSSSC